MYKIKIPIIILLSHAFYFTLFFIFFLSLLPTPYYFLVLIFIVSLFLEDTTFQTKLQESLYFLEKINIFKNYANQC